MLHTGIVLGLFAAYCFTVAKLTSLSDMGSAHRKSSCNVSTPFVERNGAGKCFELTGALKWVHSSGDFSQMHRLEKPDQTLRCLAPTLCHALVDVAFYAPRHVQDGCSFGRCQTQFMGSRFFAAGIPLERISDFSPSAFLSAQDSPACRIPGVVLGRDQKVRSSTRYIPIYLQATYRFTPANLTHTFHAPLVLKDGSCDAIYAAKSAPRNH